MLHRALLEAADVVHAGERRADVVRALIENRIRSEPLAAFDYADVVDPATMRPIETIAVPVRLLAAAQFGIPRLLDNVAALPPHDLGDHT